MVKNELLYIKKYMNYFFMDHSIQANNAQSESVSTYYNMNDSEPSTA